MATRENCTTFSLTEVRAIIAHEAAHSLTRAQMIERLRLLNDPYSPLEEIVTDLSMGFKLAWALLPYVPDLPEGWR